MLQPPRRAFADTFGAVVVIAFILLLLQPAWEYASDEWAITSAALEISERVSRRGDLRSACALMLAISVARLMERATLRHFRASVASSSAASPPSLYVAQGRA